MDPLEPTSYRSPSHVRPQSVTELLSLPVRSTVFDAHDGVPNWLREWPCQAMQVNHPVAWDAIVCAGRRPENKIVYLVGKSAERVTMACVYNGYGWIYTIEL